MGSPRVGSSTLGRVGGNTWIWGGAGPVMTSDPNLRGGFILHPLALGVELASVSVNVPRCSKVS